jgi:hypothetical protein
MSDNEGDLFDYNFKATPYEANAALINQMIVDPHEEAEQLRRA